MSGYVGSKLVVVEGLTGSGKSIMAHFITRQLQHHGIPASWVHEGDEPHPILIDVELERNGLWLWRATAKKGIE